MANEVEKEYSVTQCLPNSVTQCLPINGERVLAFGHRTFCCEHDMEKERAWHEVVFSFQVHSYKLKKEIPAALDETILENIECDESWDFDDKRPFDHLIGVTKWKRLLT